MAAASAGMRCSPASRCAGLAGRRVLAGTGRALPRRQVILTVRDPDRYDSVSATIFARALAEARPLPLRRIIRWLVAHRAPDFALYPQMARATWWTACSAAASTTASMRSRSSNGTSPRCGPRSRPTGCWSSTSPTAGHHCASSSVSPSPARPFPRSTNAKRGIEASMAGCSGSSSRPLTARSSSLSRMPRPTTRRRTSATHRTPEPWADHTFAFRRSGCASTKRAVSNTPGRPARVRLCRRCRQPRGLPAVRRFGRKLVSPSEGTEELRCPDRGESQKPCDSPRIP